jgi:hypothetical protein
MHLECSPQVKDSTQNIGNLYFMQYFHRFGLFIACSFLVIGAPNVWAESVSDALIVCSEESNSLKRLICFDKVVKKLNSYQQGDEVLGEIARAPAPRSAKPVDKIPEQPNAPESANKTDEVDTFGLPKPSESDTFLTDGDLHSVVSEVRQASNRRLHFVLENGQVWEKTEGGATGLPKVGDKIVINRRALSAFYIRREGVNRSFKVKRIN